MRVLVVPFVLLAACAVDPAGPSAPPFDIGPTAETDPADARPGLYAFDPCVVDAPDPPAPDLTLPNGCAPLLTDTERASTPRGDRFLEIAALHATPGRVVVDPAMYRRVSCEVTRMHGLVPSTADLLQTGYPSIGSGVSVSLDAEASARSGSARACMTSALGGAIFSESATNTVIVFDAIYDLDIVGGWYAAFEGVKHADPNDLTGVPINEDTRFRWLALTANGDTLRYDFREERPLSGPGHVAPSHVFETTPDGTIRYLGLARRDLDE